MNYEQACQLFRAIKLSNLNNLSSNLIESAINYARIRADYFIADTQQRSELEELRTAKHNVFIDESTLKS